MMAQPSRLTKFQANPGRVVLALRAGSPALNLRIVFTQEQVSVGMKAR
jgi:hypothetical protein